MVRCKFTADYYDKENQWLSYSCPEQDKRLILESDFCIFHDKNFLDKEENRKKIVEEFQKKIDGYLSTQCEDPLFCIGYHLYDTNILEKEFFNSVYFDDVIISGSFNINSKFHSHVSFRRAQFSGPGIISLLNAEFLGGNVNFSNAKFSGARSVTFERAQFSGPNNVFFNGTQFSEMEGNISFRNAYFKVKQNVSFISAKFSGQGDVSFKGAKFLGEGNVHFDSAEFSAKGYVDFSSSEFLEKGDVDFRNVSFSGKGYVSFDDIKFLKEGYISFAGAEFSGEGDVDFTRAEFMRDGDVIFDSIKFVKDGNLSFRDAYFSGEGGVFFRDIKFLKEGNVDFSGVNFDGKGEISFKEAEFAGKGNVIFNDAGFYGDGNVTFVDAKFLKEGDVYFEGVEFSGEGTVSFGSAKFSGKGYLSFASSEFSGKGYVSFYAVNFLNQGDISFSDTIFSKSGFVDFTAAKFYGATYFVDCTFECNVYFALVNFMSQNEVRFETVNLSNVSFLGSDVTRILFHENAHFGKLESKEEEFKILDERLFVKSIRKEKGTTVKSFSKLKDVPYNLEAESLGNILASYRNLRENYEYRLRYDEAGQFFIKEMEMKRKYREKLSISEKRYIPIENRWFRRNFSLTGIYYHLSRYGESISRPIMLGVIIVGLSTLFWLIQNNPAGEPSLSYTAKTSAENFINFTQFWNNTHTLKAFERSLADFLPLLSMPNDTKIGIIDFVVKIVGGGLTFVLLGVALRRKFERKYTR